MTIPQLFKQHVDQLFTQAWEETKPIKVEKSTVVRQKAQHVEQELVKKAEELCAGDPDTRQEMLYIVYRNLGAYRQHFLN